MFQRRLYQLKAVLVPFTTSLSRIVTPGHTRHKSCWGCVLSLRE